MKVNCIDFVVNINGTKKPNVSGRDIFRFLYCPYSLANYWIRCGQVTPYQSKSLTTREQALNYRKNTSAQYYSALLLMDNWEFKEDYPYAI